MVANCGYVRVKGNFDPLDMFIGLIKAAFKALDRDVNCPLHASELFRIEQTQETAGTLELTITFYPSDAFLEWAATALAQEV